MSTSKIMTKLEALDLSNTHVSLRGLCALDKSRELPELKGVKYLGNKVFVDKEFEILFRDMLRFLLLHSARNGMRERELDMRTLPLLLDLSCTGFGDQGAKALSKSKFVGRLERLELTETSVKTKGLILLVNAEGLAKLRW